MTGFSWTAAAPRAAVALSAHPVATLRALRTPLWWIQTNAMLLLHVTKTFALSPPSSPLRASPRTASQGSDGGRRVAAHFSKIRGETFLSSFSCSPVVETRIMFWILNAACPEWGGVSWSPTALVRCSTLLFLSLFAEHRGHDSRTTCEKHHVFTCQHEHASSCQFQGKDSHWPWFIYHRPPGPHGHWPSQTPALQSRPPFNGH